MTSSRHANSAIRLGLVALGIVSAGLLAIACRTSRSVAYIPGLGEIMTLTLMRPIKLWFAVEAGNWQLADYELDELEEGFADVARFHPTHKEADRPLTELVPEFVALPLRELRAAVLHQEVSAFVTSYDSLTIACNGCHAATGFSFNIVSRPATNPYSNQQF